MPNFVHVNARRWMILLGSEIGKPVKQDMDVIMVHKLNEQLKKYVNLNLQGMVACGIFNLSGSSSNQWIGALEIMVWNGIFKPRSIGRNTVQE